MKIKSGCECQFTVKRKVCYCNPYRFRYLYDVRLYTLILLLLISSLCLAQVYKKKLVPQFNFDQIDSLVHTCYTGDTVIAVTHWYIGSHKSSKKYFTTDNLFETFVFSYHNRKSNLQKIDNYSYYKKHAIDGNFLNKAIDRNFALMKSESMSKRVDTAYTNGDTLYLFMIVDHELVTYVHIMMPTDSLKYEFPASYSHNKANLKTRQYQFMSMLDAYLKQYNKQFRRIKTVRSKNYNSDSPH